MISIIFLLLLILILFVFLFLQQKKQVTRLTENLQELEEIQEIKIIKSNLEGRDQERARIAKDWHDGIGNSLSTLRLIVDTIQPHNQERHAEALSLLEHTQQEFRQIIDNELINGFSTEIAVRNCFEQWKRQFNLGNIKMNFVVYNLLEYNEVSIKIKAHLYRMTQELLTNILKHSEASIIQVELEMIKNRLQLFVSDNGKGGKQTPVLRSVEERLESLNGQIEIEITEGTGTSIKLFIPLN